ncbi:hypothetical protein OF83DRAFT_1178361 [Amylostereum chailletii]|nr:hypothetical protein OF83DRAFT_1178361 [Amylostereum chailletii]
MTYWESPEVLLRDYAAVIKVNHTMAGVVIWEVLMTISYEFGLFTKRRTYRWTIWIHMFCRVASLLAFLFIMAHDYTIEKTKCQAYSTTLFVFSCVSLALASFIIVLRVIAVWERKILPSVAAVLFWLASVVLNFRLPSLVHSTWNDAVNACGLSIGKASMVNVPAMFSSEVILGHGARWALGIPAVVLVALNLSDPLNLIMQPVVLASLSICATRMYRSLSEYGSITECRSDGRWTPRKGQSVQVSEAVFAAAARTGGDTDLDDVESVNDIVLDISKDTDYE